MKRNLKNKIMMACSYRIALVGLMSATFFNASAANFEILSNRRFEEEYSVKAPPAKWTLPGGTLPTGWEPEYTYGNAEAEVVRDGDTNRVLRLKRGALRQRLDLAPSVAERVMEISFDARGHGASCLIRVNGKDCFSISKQLTHEWRRFRGQVLIQPGERLTRFAIWSHTEGAEDIQIDNVSAQLAEAAVSLPTQHRNVPVPESTTTATTWLKTGAQGLSVSLCGRDGSTNTLHFHPFNLQVIDGEERDGVTFVTRVLADAGITVSGLQKDLRRFVRPNLMSYKPERMKALMADWESLPPAQAYRFPLILQRNGNRIDCLVDYHYAGSLQVTGGLQSVTFTTPQGSDASETAFEHEPLDPCFTPLALAAFQQPSTRSTTAHPKGGSKRIAGVPFFQEIQPEVSVDLARTAQHRKNFDHRYTCRSPFDALGESVLAAVPAEQYTRAWILCALEPDPEKDPSLTARLTRFVPGGAFSGRGRESLADTTVRLPQGSESAPDGFTRVGTVTLKGQPVPLWLAEIPLRSGEITDIIFDDVGPKMQNEPIRSSLDFELLGPLMSLAHSRTDTRHWPLEKPVSGVHVYGVTLEKPAVEMEVRQNELGNIFHNNEKPRLRVALRPRRDGTYQLRRTIRNAEGQEVDAQTLTLDLRAGADEIQVAVELTQPEPGWYEIVFDLEQAGRTLLTHTASFALLGPDTRQAGVVDSPFGTWWYNYHYCPKDPSLGAGPLSLKAGLRRNAGVTSNETSLAAWKTTAGTLGWPGSLLARNASDAEIKKYIDDEYAKFPSCNNIMIFHENAEWAYRVAPELIGMQPLPEHEFSNADKLFAQAMRLGKLVRENYPHLKIVIGNSLGCSELIAELLRRGFPEAYADYLGLEIVGRTGQPEKLWAGGQQTAWLMREVARIYGYKTWRITSCVESNYRHDRLLGQQLQAEWYVRDALLLMAYGAPHISIAVLFDTGNTYNSGFWGGTGLCRRYPFLYPKKTYVAMATLTKALDRAELIREMPTGSLSVYALEFKRPDGQRVYAVWTGRGTAELTLRFAENSRYELTDLYGRSRTGSTFWGRKRLKLTAGTAVKYLTCSQPLDAIICGNRAYPEDQPPSNLRVVAPMDSVADWRLAHEVDPFLEETSRTELPYRTAGTFELRQVQDEEKGPCLEVELAATTNLPALMSEYTVLRLNKSVTIEGNPTTLGLWVKGNSGWGEVYWEIEDANGVRRLSCGTTAHGTSVFDYDARLATVNFDGWNFLRMPITEKSPVPDLSTGSVGNLWQKTKEGAVAYPIKVTGVAVSLPPRALYLTEMEPVRQVLRLKELSVYE